MKNRRRLFSVLLLLLCSPVVCCSAAFAAEESIENWYNSQQPYGETVYFYDAVGDSPAAVYSETGLSYTNTASSNTATMSFGFSVPEGVDGWEVAMVNAYDYYVNLVVFSEVESESEFSFYPGIFSMEYNDHDGTHINTTLEDVNISHFDTAHYLGYTCTGRIPDNDYFGCPIRMVRAHGATGSYPANLRVFIIIYQIPKSDSSTVDGAQAIVNALSSQTQTLVNEMNRQTGSITDSIKDSTDRIMDDSDFGNNFNYTLEDGKALGEDLLAVDPTDRLGAQLLPQLTKEKYTVEIPALRGPFLPGGEYVTIIEPQTVDLSFMDEFSVITDATGFMAVVCSAWLTIKFLHKKLMLILGDPEAVEE